MTGSEAVGLGAAACAVSLVATPIAARIATRIGFIDRPGPHKPQKRATPYLGGFGVGCGVALGAAFFRPWLLVPFALALGLGTADDAWPLPASSRLIGELSAGVVLAAVVSTRFGPAGYVLVPLATVALINGCNLIDGLDALCGSTVFVAAVGFGLLLSGGARGMALAVAGAAGAFLVFNRPPAKVYLGDGGSYLLGISLAALLAVAWAPGLSQSTGVGALALVLLPLVEVGSAAVRRVRAGGSPFSPDRNHPYDVLVRSGWSVGRTVGAYLLVGLVLIGVAAAASHLRVPLAWVLVGLATTALFLTAVGVGARAPTSRSADGVST
jgi:UDP-GlcNAc:undecaprenyl-phosphate GlcNAc-1-phosphate transferase